MKSAIVCAYFFAVLKIIIGLLRFLVRKNGCNTISGAARSSLLKPEGIRNRIRLTAVTCIRLFHENNIDLFSPLKYGKHCVPEINQSHAADAV